MITVEPGRDGGHDDAEVPVGEGWRRTMANCVPGAQAVRDLRYRYRGVEKSLSKIPPARMLTTIPRTGGFAYRTLVRRRRVEPRAGLPDTRLTPSLLASVAMDEAILT